MPTIRTTAKNTVSPANEADAGTPLFEVAYNRIKELIFQRKLAPGQRLIYKDLCQMLSISRTPIINALTRLEQEGYVKSESFRGFYVKPIDIQEISDGFGIREALEAYAIEQALKSMQPDDLEDLKTKIAEHAEYMPPVYDKKKFYLDAAVHIRIAEITGNQGLVQMLTKNLEHVYLRLAMHTHHPDRMNPAVKEHNELLKLIESGEEEACIALMRRHIQRGRDQLIASLEREETYQAL
jgi:DNA-binding GntR family transcriptional regulator